MFRVLTWASLLLLVLYSPFGSPDLYSPRSYFKPQQSVDFKGSDIANASQVSKRRSNNTGYQESSVQDINMELKRGIASNAVSGNIKQTEGNFSSFSTTPKESSSSVSSGFSNGLLGSDNKTKSNSNENSGMQSLSSDLSIVSENNVMTKQSVGTGLTGTTDPGGDPTGDPIPVGDGWILLMVFVTGYALLKMKLLRK